MKFAIYTLGCKVNQYESQALERELLRRGYERGGFDEPCDLYIVNTCTVTAVSDKKSRNALRRARKLSPDAVIGVCGCYAQVKPEDMDALSVDVVGGTGDRGAFIDRIVVTTDPEKNHRMTMGEYYNPAYTGKYKYPVAAAAPLPLNVHKTIARRAAMELQLHVPVNTGLGYPEGIANVANEEGIADDLILTVETGAFGGVPAARTSFGSTTNAMAFVDSPTIFDLYDSGYLYATFVGLAECQADGSVNVSRFVDKAGNERRPGAGGFIDLTQGARNVIFCGTMTAGGYKSEVRDGKLVILKEGAEKKFVKKINQITFSGPHAMEIAQNVLYITDRAVFRLTKDGLVLEEIAPGIDLKTQILPYMDFEPIISPDLKEMDPKIFREGLIGLKEQIH